MACNLKKEVILQYENSPQRNEIPEVQNAECTFSEGLKNNVMQYDLYSFTGLV